MWLGVSVCWVSPQQTVLCCKRLGRCHFHSLLLNVWKESNNNHQCHQIKCTSYEQCHNLRLDESPLTWPTTSHPTQQCTWWFTSHRLDNAHRVQNNAYSVTHTMNTHTVDTHSCAHTLAHRSVTKHAAVQYKTTYAQTKTHANVQKVSTEKLSTTFKSLANISHIVAVFKLPSATVVLWFQSLDCLTYGHRSPTLSYFDRPHVLEPTHHRELLDVRMWSKLPPKRCSSTYTYPFSSRELGEKIDTILSPVRQIKGHNQQPLSLA